MVEVEVYGISIAPNTGTPIVLLKPKEDSLRKLLLPIWIGPPEAWAIQWPLKGHIPSRPMTHDLLKNAIESLGAKVVSVYVHSMKEETYFGQITLDVNGKSIELDSRPSDAIALALRCGATIYVAKNVIEKHSISEADVTEAEEQQAKSSLENLDEDTLGQYTV